MTLIDLSSDTVTRPSTALLEAMIKAPVGDEQRGDDPSVNALQSRVAALLGQQAALLFPSATMANQVAIAVQCEAGDEVVCHESAHVYRFEGGGLARNARAQCRPLGGSRGRFGVEQLSQAIRPEDPHYPRTRLVVMENTSNLGGGAVWPLAEFEAVTERCRQAGLSVHLDGARLLNAQVASATPAARWGELADSVQLCFSKGLGCPFGAVLAGSARLMAKARRVKQAMGGALRQAGVIAGGMLYALDHHVERMAEDHRRAAWFAEQLAEHPELSVEPVETNLVYFRLASAEAGASLAKLLKAGGLGVHCFEDGRLRACTHLNVDDRDMEVAAGLVAHALVPSLGFGT